MIIETSTFNNTDFNTFSSWFMNLDLRQFKPTVIEGPQRPDSFQDDDWRMPKSLNLVNLFGMGYPQDPAPGGIVDTIYSFVQTVPVPPLPPISEGTGAELCIAGYYPAGGHIGWHTNSNFAGYNILLTYSDTGDSFFEYVNSEGNVTRLDDPVGWSYKIIKWGIGADKVWHRAHAQCDRMIITFFSTDESNIIAIKNKL